MHSFQFASNFKANISERELFLIEGDRNIFPIDTNPEINYHLLNGTIKLNFFRFLISIGKEQLWFGPAKHASILMTTMQLQYQCLKLAPLNLLILI